MPSSPPAVIRTFAAYKAATAALADENIATSDATAHGDQLAQEIKAFAAAVAEMTQDLAAKAKEAANNSLSSSLSSNLNK